MEDTGADARQARQRGEGEAGPFNPHFFCAFTLSISHVLTQIRDKAEIERRRLMTDADVLAGDVHSHLSDSFGARLISISITITPLIMHDLSSTR